MAISTWISNEGQSKCQGQNGQRLARITGWRGILTLIDRLCLGFGCKSKTV